MKYQSARNGTLKEYESELALELAAYLRTLKPESKGELNAELLKFRYEGEQLLVNQLAPVFVMANCWGVEHVAGALERGEDLR